MKNFLRCLSVLLAFAVVPVFAQESVPVDAQKTETKKVEKATAGKSTEVPGDKTTEKPASKMVQNASFNLGTTITGNQEQPKVLYILPWQSPQTDNVDFEMLDNEQKAVFGHVEREELRRELESLGDN